MSALNEFVFIGIMSFTLSIIIIPFLIKLALFSGLVDKPNYRKLHANPIPLVGGIAIFISSLLALTLSNTFLSEVMEMVLILAGGVVLLVTGSIDDKIDIKPIYRLIIQMGCAYALASTGIRITSFHGLFGIYELGLGVQYFFTLVIITGVVNAFNLMDGVDGLAGGLALLGFVTLGVLSFVISAYGYVVLFIALTGATCGFLKYNLGKKKIFLGDGGSLSLGFILVVAGISIIEKSTVLPMQNHSVILMAVISIFMLPVLDSLRVYIGRIRNGVSPFKADKSHIHHLVLLLNNNHKQTSLFIIFIAALLLSLSLIMISHMSVTLVLFMGVLSFYFLMKVLSLNKELNEWKIRLKKIENY